MVKSLTTPGVLDRCGFFLSSELAEASADHEAIGDDEMADICGQLAMTFAAFRMRRCLHSSGAPSAYPG